MPDQENENLIIKHATTMAVTSLLEKSLKRPFSPDKIKWRAADFKADSSRALLYISARDVMDRLDEVVGPQRWETNYESLTGVEGCVCTLSIRYESEDWTRKSDVGTPSTFEGTKGMYSDALKRAAVQHGIGRYLYDDDILRGKRFKLSGKFFSDQAEEEISKIIHQHYNFYGHPIAEVLKNLFNSAGTLEMLKDYHRSNKEHIKRLKDNDTDSAKMVEVIFKQKYAILKLMEEN